MSEKRAPADAGASDQIFRRIVTIGNRRGLHARAAAKFVQLAEQFDAEIWVAKKDVAKKDTVVSGLSIMGLMMLAAGPGLEIELRARGAQAETAICALADLVQNKFDEEDEA